MGKKSTFSSFIFGMFKVVYTGPEGRKYMAMHSLTERRGLTKSDTENDSGKDAVPASDVYSAICKCTISKDYIFSVLFIFQSYLSKYFSFRY